VFGGNGVIKFTNEKTLKKACNNKDSNAYRRRVVLIKENRE
jgi:hypothetical protein